MPYLHWEIEQRLRRMSEVVREATRLKKRKEVKSRRRPSNFTNTKEEDSSMQRQCSKPHDTVSDRGVKFEPLPAPNMREEGSWKPQSPLALYLWHVAKLFEIT